MAEKALWEGERVVAERRGVFGAIQVIEAPNGLRLMRFADGGSDQSAVMPGKRNYLEFGYMQALVGAFAIKPKPKRVLCIGLGGGALPAFIRHHLPLVEIDIVEIDPAVVALAEEAMGFKTDAAMRVWVGDIRDYFAQTEQQWDLIFLDAYGEDGVPEELVTEDFYASVAAHLEPRGLLAANLWSPLSNIHYGSTLHRIEALFGRYAVAVPPGGSGRLLLAAHRGDLSQGRFVDGVVALQRRWDLHFDLLDMALRAYHGPE